MIADILRTDEIFTKFKSFLPIIVIFHSLSLFFSLISGQVDILKQFPVRTCNDNFSFFLCSRVNTGRLDSFPRMPQMRTNFKGMVKKQ